MTEGPPMLYVPVVKHPRDYPQRCFGPIGWERVEVVVECPLCVEPERNEDESTP